MNRNSRIRKTVAQMNIWATISLLAVAILIPTIWVVWLAREATQNERAAMERIIADSKTATLENAEKTIQTLINDWFATIEGMKPGVAFQTVSEQSVARSFIQYDNAGEVLYPSSTSVRPLYSDSDLWELEKTLGNIQSAIRSGEHVSALSKIHALLPDDSMKLQSGDGRSMGPSIVLLGLSIAEQSEESHVKLLQALREMCVDYEKWEMPSSQRQFIQGRFLKEQADPKVADLRNAEKLAATWSDYAAKRLQSNESQSIFTEADHVIVFKRSQRAAFVFDGPQFFEQINSILANASAFGALSLRASQIGDDSDAGIHKILGGIFSGWELVLNEPLSTTSGRHQNQSLILYGWISALVILVSLSLSIVIAGLIRRQMNLAQLKNDLVSTVSHELKTPIASIRLLVDTLIADKKPNPEKTRDYLELVSRENMRLGHLIENFLSFSRMERGQNTFHLEPCSPLDIASEATSAFRERFTGADYDLTETIDPQANDILADRDAIVAALGNLLENAYKYGGDSKRIRLHVDNRGANVAFSIEDNGTGIPPKEQAKVFNRFYQGGDRNLSEHRGGVGLGLSIVQFIVSKHHGEVDLESSINKGSVFTISIPHA